MAKPAFTLLLFIQVCTSYRIQLTPQEAAKMLHRAVDDKSFNEGAQNFVTGPVNVPKLLPNDATASSRSIEDIKRELSKVWRELHSSSMQLQHHSILPKKEAMDDLDAIATIDKRDTADTDQVSVKSSHERSLSKTENELRKRSSRMEKLENIVNDLLQELESDQQKRETKQEKTTKRNAEQQIERLQNDINKLSKLSDELKRSGSQEKRQKMNGIGREIDNSHLDETTDKRGKDQLARVASLVSLLAKQQKRSQNEQSFPPSPKLNGIGRELKPADAFQKLLRSYVNDRMKRVSNTEKQLREEPMITMKKEVMKTSTSPMIPMKDKGAEHSKRASSREETEVSTKREKIILKAVQELMNKKRAEKVFAKKENGAGTEGGETQTSATVGQLIELLAKKLKKDGAGSHSGNEVEASRRAALLKRAVALAKLENSFPFFKKSIESDKRSELKEVKALEGKEDDNKLVELKRRELLLRLIQMYRRSAEPNSDRLERELALFARDRFPVDSSRFTSNRIGTNKPEAGPNSSTTQGHGKDFDSLLNAHGDGISHQTSKTLKGFHKPGTREMNDPPRSHAKVSPETSSTLSGFSSS